MLARPFCHLRSVDGWARARHIRTAIDLPDGGVMLAWRDADPDPGADVAPELGSGLGFDSRCRLYRTLPEQGHVERYPWQDGPRGSAEQLVVADEPPPAGEFEVGPPASGPLAEPRGLALDDDDRLWVAETGARRVVLWDLWSRRLLRRISVPGRPLDLACRGRRVLALLHGNAGIAVIEDRTLVDVLALPELGGTAGPAAQARRLAIAPDRGLGLLLRDPAGPGAWIARLRLDPEQGLVTDGEPQAVEGASDLAWLDERTLVIARAPGQTFIRRVKTEDGFIDMPGLVARGYDGLGIARAPAGRGIAYWSEHGPRIAVTTRVTYERSGEVTTFRLAADAPATRWGRLFVDACVPEGTHLRARFLTSDEPDGPGELARTPPANAADLEVPHGELSPPLPWGALVAAPAAAAAAAQLHRRESGRELPWVRPQAADLFETYETPVKAPPGRYLWVTLELEGNGRATPRVRSLRAERPAHDHLNRLPRAFSRGPAAAEFLQRYLALADGLMSDLGGRSDARATLISPFGAPAEALDWLAGFLGLTLDERWPEAVRRQVIDEAPWLLRFRGTKRGLERLLELIVGRDVMILERWRLRGAGGALLEGGDAPAGAAVVGGGLRVGGEVGATGAEPATEDAFATHAHRFTVLVPALLSAEQTGMIEHALDVHRPAHTIFELCTLGSGMRVGRGLHVGLLSTIGRTGGWEPLAADRGVVGRGIVGRPRPGVSVGAAGLGHDSVVG
jgi:phage tail-like protein